MPFAIVGEAGSVILFVCSGVGLVIVGGYFVALAARSYLVVVQGTAVGIDQVEWPDESPVDWLGQSFAVLFHLLLWIMPAGFLARALATTWLPANPPLRFFVLMGVAAWLLFPLGFLLSMSHADLAGSLGRLVTRLPVILLFYLLTAGLFLAGLGLTYFGLFTAAWYAVPLAALLGPAVVLIHARMVGRLGYLIGRREAPGKPKKRKKKRREPAESDDPWAAPEEEPVEAEEVKPPKPSYEEDAPDPYAMAEAGPEPERPTAPRLALEGDQVEREVKLRRREELKPPPSLFFAGVWEFPWYPTTLKAYVWLAAFAVAAGGIGRFMVSVAPFGGGP